MWQLETQKQASEMRAMYAKVLEELLEENEKVVMLDADLASSSGAGHLFHQYPHRCIDVGISEANMISAGAGMSFTGLLPYAHTFAPFISRRVLDQIYMSLSYAKGSMHICASDPGFWAQYNGGTHSTFEDLAQIKSMPNIKVSAPSDPITYAWVLREYAQNPGVYYTRVPRKKQNHLYTENSQFEWGKANIVREGKDLVIFALGSMVHDALEAANILAEDGIDACVVDFLFVKPYDQNLVLDCIEKYPLIVSVENHQKVGGMGDLIASDIASIPQTKTHLVKIGMDNRFGEVGDVEYLKKTYGLTADDIVKTIKNNL